MDGNGDLISTLIQTKNTKPCGMPGEYILILPDFFIGPNNKTTPTLEDKGTVIYFYIMLFYRNFMIGNVYYFS